MAASTGESCTPSRVPNAAARIQIKVFIRFHPRSISLFTSAKILAGIAENALGSRGPRAELSEFKTQDQLDLPWRLAERRQGRKAGIAALAAKPGDAKSGRSKNRVR